MTSGQTAALQVGCTFTGGIHRENSTVGVNVGTLLKSSTVKTTGDTIASPVKMTMSSTVQGLSLLNGLIKATAVRAQSNTTRTLTGFSSDAAGSTFTSLTIAGVPRAATAPANTVVYLAGFGFVVLNSQGTTTTATSRYFQVAAMVVVINQPNSLNIPVGTNVTVARANSGLVGPVSSTLAGVAYGTSANLLNNTLTSGPTFPATMPCQGTNGLESANTGAGVNVPNVLVSGTIKNTAKGTNTATSANGRLTSTVQSANVLAGLVNASVIKADVTVTKNALGAVAVSDSGSSFASLSVSGRPLINANVAPNTSIQIAGLGTLWLHRVIKTANSVEVRMIQLIVTQANTRGLPIGSDIRVAVAYGAIT